jgi:photosystem II stability/assembly factor-like uncharacterized protein
LVFSCTIALPLPAQETSEPAPLAAQGLLLDIAKAGDQLIAVGEHGHVVVSRDDGHTWTQRSTPTRALLTSVSFPDARHGWVVGHDGVILVTADAGQTWQRQDDGKSVETVFLSVLFFNTSDGFAVGAYGKFLATSDGGKKWTAFKPVEGESHYNRISAAADGSLYLAGEAGTLLSSRDGGKHWQRLKVPYDGSLFGCLPLDQGRLIAYGLRGHILRSEDRGARWQSDNSEVRVLIMAGLRLSNGTVILGGQGGNFFLSHDAGQNFSQWKPANFGTSVADFLETSDGILLTVGEAGAVRISLPP